MCWTIGMSTTMAGAAFALAAYEWKTFHCRHYSLGIGYWGLMELLQSFQHIWAADASDDYAMCSNTINQVLTEVGMLHVVFQPLFCGMLMMSMLRRYDPEARIQADLIFNMCLLMGLWFLSNEVLNNVWRTEQFRDSRATEENPNFGWAREGYDGAAHYTTPNVPGESCTYYAPTSSGHLSWVSTLPPESYFFPGTSVHCFCMFAPYFAMTKRPMLQVYAFALWVTGPYVASMITPAVNEQPAIWCLYSVLQVIIFVVTVRTQKLYLKTPPHKLVLPGVKGEETLVYVRYYGKPESETNSLSSESQLESMLPMSDVEEDNIKDI